VTPLDCPSGRECALTIDGCTRLPDTPLIVAGRELRFVRGGSVLATAAVLSAIGALAARGEYLPPEKSACGLLSAKQLAPVMSR
jgi:hypothetical protein